MRLLLSVLGAALAAVLSVSLLPAAGAGADAATVGPPADDGAETGRLVLLLDSSGSMKEPAAGGGTKIEAAKDALRDVATKLPDSAEVGIRVFGAKVFERSKPGACRDTQNVVPVGPLDRDRLEKAVADYRPYGETPIGNALKGAAQDLGPARKGERRTIVLLSDGEPTCAPDPCKVARQLRNQGVDLRVNVVGLDVSGKARKALRCIADAGGGRYFDADSAEELADSMVQVSVRALRLFRLHGEPVTGGTSTADPAAVEPGNYVDETVPDGGSKFYLVDLPKGGAVSASAVLRPEGGSLVDTLHVELMTPDGGSCARDLTQRINVLGLSSIVGTAAHYDSHTEGLNSEACRAAEKLLVHVTFEGPATPFGLRVRSYPEVRDPSSLPPPVDFDQRASWEVPVALSGAGTPVVGGGTFEDAPELEPGTTYRDTLRPREQLIYKVTVPWGTAPRMTARLETDTTAQKAQGALGVNVRAGAFNPLAARMSETSNSETGITGSGFYNGEKPLTLTSAQPPVHYRNIEDTDARVTRSSVAGTYWFTLEMGGESDRAAERFQAPVRIAVDLGGEAGGEPDYAGTVEGSPSPTASPSEPSNARAAADSSSDDGGQIPWLPLGVGAGILVVLAALVGGFVLGRRGRPA